MILKFILLLIISVVPTYATIMGFYTSCDWFDTSDPLTGIVVMFGFPVVINVTAYLISKKKNKKAKVFFITTTVISITLLLIIVANTGFHLGGCGVRPAI